MKKNLFNFIIILTILIVGAGLVNSPIYTVHAQTIIEDIGDQAANFGRILKLPDKAQDPIQLVGNVITYLLTFLGVVFLLLIIWAGFTWMISQGDDTKIKKARKIIGASVMGLIVIVLSLAIVQFVILILGKTQL